MYFLVKQNAKQGKSIEAIPKDAMDGLLAHSWPGNVRELESCSWKVKGSSNAAEQLGLKESTLRARMKKLGIKRPAS